MTDTPKYQRDTAIKPAQPAQGFGEVTGQFASFASNIGKMGANLAQESVNKYAHLQGIESAQKSLETGKPNIVLPITEADKHFAKAYQEEYSQSLNYEGHKALQNLQMTAIKNPTSDSLGNFEELGKQTIDEMVQKAPRESRAVIRRSLEESYLAAKNRLSLQVDKTNREYMQSQHKVQDDQQRRLIVDSNLLGNQQAAVQAYEDRLETIAQRERVYLNTGGQEGYDPAQADLEKRLAKQKLEVSGLQYGYVQAMKEQKGSEYLKDLRESKPEGMTPSEHDDAVKAVLSYGNEYQAALSSQQGINYLKYATMVDTGQMTESDLIQARKDISEGQFAQLERYIATRSDAATKATRLFNESAGKQDDAGFMARYSGAEVDTIFAKKVELYNNSVADKTGEPHEATLGERAMLAQSINAPIPALSKELSRTANYGNPQQAVEAVRAMVMLDRNNHGVNISDMDNHDKAILNTFRDLSANTAYGPDEALKLARDTTNVDPNTKQSRIEGWKEYQKTDSKYRDINKKIKYIGDNIGANFGWFRDRAKTPTGLDVAFDRVMNSLVPLYDTPKRAEQEAFQQMSRVYQPTDVNNRNEIMRLAPEERLWNDRYRSLKEVVDANKTMQAEGKFVMNKLDWPDAPDTKDILGKSLITGDIKILVDGQPRKVVIDSDLDTQWNTDLGLSWPFFFLDEDGVQMPIVDSQRGIQARWVPDWVGLEKLVPDPEQYKIRQIEKAHSDKLKAMGEERIRSESGQYSPMIGGLI